MRPRTRSLATALVSVVLAGSAFPGDSLVEVARLRAAEGLAGDQAGWSVEMQGDVMVVGAPFATVDGNADEGEVYVYEKTGPSWTSMIQRATLSLSNGGVLDRLGYSVAIDGDTIVAGALGTSSAIGAAYVFEKPAGGWRDMTETAMLQSSDISCFDTFGKDVAILGNTVLVSADDADSVASRSGTVYLFQKSGPQWVDTTEFGQLDASNGAFGDSFGERVVFQDGLIVVGAPGVGASRSHGRVYVFEEPPGGWTTMTETAQLRASDPAQTDWLGAALAVDGDTIVAGAYLKDNGATNEAGAIYVFEKPPGGWVNAREDAKLLASDGGPRDFLGQAVAVRGTTVVAGAPMADVAGAVDQGALYLYERPAGGWADATETEKLLASDGIGDDEFGTSLAMEGATILAGAPGVNLTGLGDRGAAYVLDVPHEVASSGCGLDAPTVRGSSRLGSSFTADLDPCVAGAAHGVFVGNPLSTSYVVSPALACEPLTPCVLACAPQLVYSGTSATVPIPTGLDLIGLVVCVQGLCLEPTGCVRLTVAVTLTLSA